VRPQGTRVLRREQRHAWRGISRGRRSTHKVVTTYGRGQELAAHIERWRGLSALRCAVPEGPVYLGLIIPVAVYDDHQQAGAAA
jgi:hypothetical protein